MVERLANKRCYFLVDRSAAGMKRTPHVLNLVISVQVGNFWRLDDYLRVERKLGVIGSLGRKIKKCLSRKYPMYLLDISEEEGIQMSQCEDTDQCVDLDLKDHF